jgi:hypothetical protein
MSTSARLTASSTAPTREQGLASDPIDDLAARMRPSVRRPVDAMEVAAALEANGILDRSAQDRYGHRDVFELAEEVFARLDDPAPAPAARSATDTARRPGVREVSHGLLYLLPGVLLPALPSLVGVHRLVLALLTASGLGWVWSAGSAWLAYRLLGRGLSRSASRALRAAALSGVTLGAVAGGVVAASAGGGVRLAGIVAGLLAFHMASTIALVYRREAWLVATMMPGVLAGAAHVAYGRPDAALAAGIGAGSIVLSLGIALWQTIRQPVPDSGRRAAPPAEPPLRHAVRPELAQLGGVLLYAALSAAFLLHVDARYLSDRLGLAVAAAPLIVGMGVVEWRTRRFHEQADGLLHRSTDPRQFTVAVWGRLLASLLSVLGLVGLLAGGLLVTLDRTDLLDAPAAMLIAAHVAVGGAFFLAFVVAGKSRYGRLCAALTATLAIDVAVVRLWPGGASPLREGAVLLACAVLLQVLLAASLLRVPSHAWLHSSAAT